MVDEKNKREEKNKTDNKREEKNKTDNRREEKNKTDNKREEKGEKEKEKGKKTEKDESVKQKNTYASTRSVFEVRFYDDVRGLLPSRTRVFSSELKAIRYMLLFMEENTSSDMESRSQGTPVSCYNVRTGLCMNFPRLQLKVSLETIPLSEALARPREHLEFHKHEIRHSSPNDPASLRLSTPTPAPTPRLHRINKGVSPDGLIRSF